MTVAHETQWFPIAESADLPFRHVYHAELLGQELAVWRADDGHVNVWENRCLHRGVRLTLGSNLGNQLKCRYHGWLCASRTSACTYIPAHPENAPARLICNKVFPSAERGGFVWSGLKAEGNPSPRPGFDGKDGVTIRSLPVHAPYTDVVRALESGWPSLARASEFTLVDQDDMHCFFVQPQNASRSIIRGIVREPLVSLREINHRLTVLRDRIENAR